MVSLTHKFVSGKADGPDTTVVKPSNWNDQHNLTVATSSVLGATAAGNVVELPLMTTGSGDSGTMITRDVVTAAIAAAMANVDIPATGDLCTSLAPTKTNWVLCNGQTIGNAGSPANIPSVATQNLFNLLWAINGGTWPVLPSRGASAAADWAAGHTIAVPDARGFVLGMLDYGRGLVPSLVNLGLYVGEATHVLTPNEIPPPTANTLVNINGGSPAQASTSINPSTPLYFSNSGYGNASGVADGHNIVQPTMGVNIFIKL